ncbi:MAG: YdhR family protein [Pseudomonadota bacterium]
MDFATAPPWGEERVAALSALAESIARDTPGLLWKIWTEDQAAGRAGGLYAFASRAEAEAYRVMHTARAAGRGATDICAHVWDVNAPLSTITHAPLPGALP